MADSPRATGPASAATPAGEVTFDFSRKVVVITGCLHGIGRAVAEAFAIAGATLHLIDAESGIVDDAGRIQALGAAQATGHACDIRDQAQLAKIMSSLDVIDVLINNAGLEMPTPFDDMGDDIEQRARVMVDVNLIGTFNVTRLALSRMRPGGRIIITASIWGRVGAAGFAIYSATKHANLGLMKTLAREAGPRGIAVNAVCPGWIRTRASEASILAQAKAEGVAHQVVVERMLAAQAMPGITLPEDIAGVYLFLASDAARCMTGEAITVDRGELCF